MGRDSSDLTRQICNAWKSDRGVAQVVLRADIGRACARLGGWPGARLSQDNVLWKPPGGKALGFHQDSSYEQWAVPPDWVSCWIALEDTTAQGGTVEYVRGSHRWQPWGMIAEFHGPDDPHLDLREAAAAAGVQPELVPVEVPAGGGAFHAGWTWHGSGINHAHSPSPFARGALHVVRCRAFIPTPWATSTAATNDSATTQWTRRSFPSPGAPTDIGRRSSSPTATA